MICFFNPSRLLLVVGWSLVVAVAESGAIGLHNALRWHLAADLRHFKLITMGKPIVMGRLTFESIGKALLGRANIVLRRDSDCSGLGVRTPTSFDEAIAHSAREDASEIMFIGGAAIYSLALPVAQRIYLTQIHYYAAGDTYFPHIGTRIRQEVAREDHPADADAEFSYSFVTLDRRPTNPPPTAIKG